MAARIARRRADIAGRSISYAESGGEPPVLLIHGFPLDHWMWRAQIGTFGEVRRVIAPDLSGFGETGGMGHESLDGHADDLAALLDALSIERAVVAGLSMGGYIAFAFWRRHRHRVAGMVLADTKPGADTEAARAGRYQVAGAVEEKGTRVVAEAMLPKLLGPEAAEGLQKEVMDMMLRQPEAGVAAALRAMAARPDSTPDLPSIHVPVLVAVGAQDVITPVSESEAMAAALPDSRLTVIPRAGHLSPLEEPGAFNAALRQFLEDLPPA